MYNRIYNDRDPIDAVAFKLAYIIKKQQNMKAACIN